MGNLLYHIQKYGYNDFLRILYIDFLCKSDTIVLNPIETVYKPI